MSYRRKEEKAIERIIRGVLKLPENRRCINCHHVGPRYVCTVCSGVHREFGHRVKSVLVATFTSEEVIALQAGGNERAREIYLEAWDPARNTHPDGSDINKIRDFIKHVYVYKRYTGERRLNMHATEKSGDKGNFYERRHSMEKHGLSSREDFYERRYHERSSPSVRGERNYRDYTDDKSNRNYNNDKDYSKYFEGSSPHSIYERFGSHRSRSAARFEIVDNRIRDDRYGRRRSESLKISKTDTSMSPEPQRREEKADPMAPEPQRREEKADPMVPEPQEIRKKANPPVLRPLKDIMREITPIKKANHQKTALPDRQDSADVKDNEKKAASASGLIDLKNNLESPDTSSKTQTENGSSFQSSTVQKTSNPPSVNSVEFLLSELSVAPVGNASENPITNTASPNAPNTSSTNRASPTAPNTSSTNTASPTAPNTSSTTQSTPVASSTEPVASASTEPVASSVVLKASSTKSVASSTAPVTSSAVAAPTESASTPKTLANRFAEIAAASSSVGNAQTHPFNSADSVSQVAEEKNVQKTQQHQFSASPAENNSSPGPQGMPTFEALFNQPWPSLPEPTAQGAPDNASAGQSSQAVSKEAQTTISPGNGSKSSERKELPAELFTFSYPTYPAPMQNWQFHSHHGMGYGMQYAPSPNVAAFPSSAKSSNPFDTEDDSRPVQGTMSPLIASVPGAFPQMPPHAGMQPRPLPPFASGLPPESASYGMYMPTGGYVGQQIPNNTPNQRLQGTGGFGGGSAFGSINPTQHYPGVYSSNPALGTSNYFPSAGGNPFA